MVVITKKKGETKDSMFKKFTRTYLEEEIIDEVRDRMHYKKPSQVAKEKEKERRSKKSKDRIKSKFKSRRIMK